jgi:hypothetical protein
LNTAVYLPPYSPDFSPIEECWSKVKTFLRAKAARTLEALEQAIAEALAAVTSQDAHGCGKDMAAPSQAHSTPSGAETGNLRILPCILCNPYSEETSVDILLEKRLTRGIWMQRMKYIEAPHKGSRRRSPLCCTLR